MTAPSNANTSGLAPTDALRLVPVEPTEAVLTNMAIRFDHGLGCPGYYDNPYFFEGPSHARRFEAAKTTMRQLYEEVVLSAAAPASPLPGGGWRTDFENAPKDGRWIVTIDKWRNAETMRWSNEVSRLFPEHGERGWVAKGGYSPNTRPELSVAWAELPAAPTGEPK